MKQQGITQGVKKKGDPVVQFMKLLDELVPYQLFWAKSDDNFRKKRLGALKKLAVRLREAMCRMKKLENEPRVRARS